MMKELQSKLQTGLLLQVRTADLQHEHGCLIKIKNKKMQDLGHDPKSKEVEVGGRPRNLHFLQTPPALRSESFCPWIPQSAQFITPS